MNDGSTLITKVLYHVLDPTITTVSHGAMSCATHLQGGGATYTISCYTTTRPTAFNSDNMPYCYIVSLTVTNKRAKKIAVLHII